MNATRIARGVPAGSDSSEMHVNAKPAMSAACVATLRKFSLMTVSSWRSRSGGGGESTDGEDIGEAKG